MYGEFDESIAHIALLKRVVLDTLTAQWFEVLKTRATVSQFVPISKDCYQVGGFRDLVIFFSNKNNKSQLIEIS